MLPTHAHRHTRAAPPRTLTLVLCPAVPPQQRPEPNAYEPIYRYPVDTGGDGTFDLPGFVARAQVRLECCD